MESTKTFSILFIVAHPALERSRANRAIMEAVTSVSGLTVHCLYDLYPHFSIDVMREQVLLSQHDLVVMQHPIYWYSMPPLLKMWLDEVLLSGWAYGPGGDKLKGKDFLLSVTAGGSDEAYSPLGQNRFAIETLLSPWNQTVHLCQMIWHRPRVLHASLQASSEVLRAHGDALARDLANYSRSGVLS